MSTDVLTPKSTKLGDIGRVTAITIGCEDGQEATPLIQLTAEMTYMFNAAASGDIQRLRQFLILNTPENTEAGVTQTLDQILGCDKTRKNRNILHLAAAYQGNQESSKDCANLILEFAHTNIPRMQYQAFVDAGDDDGATPLYLAAKYENVEACKALVFGGCDFDKSNNRGKTPIMQMFKKMPHVIAEFFSGSGNESHYVDSERQIINLHFRALISVPMEADVVSKSRGRYREMDLLSNLSFTPIKEREQILENVHVKALVWIKWQRYKWILWIARAFQISWYLLYIAYLLSLFRLHCPFPGAKVYNFSWVPLEASSDFFNYSDANTVSISERNCATQDLHIMAWLLMISAVLDVLLIEGYPTIVRFSRKWYPIKTWGLKKCWRQIGTLFEILHAEKWALLFSIIITTMPLNFNTHVVSAEGQYIFASLGMFLAWFHIFLQLGKFPLLKGYIKVFTNTLSTLCVVFLLYGSLIFAFAMVFCILLPGEVTYSSPFESLIRVFTFTIGEVDFEATFYGDEASPPASFVVTTIFFGIAILVLHVALLNYLIGLTIHEIQEVWKQANVWKTYTYMWQIFLCETFLSSFPFSFCQNLLYNRMVLQCKYEGPGDVRRGGRILFHQMKMDELPKRIQREIRQLNLDWKEEGAWDGSE